MTRLVGRHEPAANYSPEILCCYSCNVIGLGPQLGSDGRDMGDAMRLTDRETTWYDHTGKLLAWLGFFTFPADGPDHSASRPGRDGITIRRRRDMGNRNREGLFKLVDGKSPGPAVQVIANVTSTLLLRLR